MVRLDPTYSAVYNTLYNSDTRGNGHQQRCNKNLTPHHANKRGAVEEAKGSGNKLFQPAGLLRAVVWHSRTAALPLAQRTGRRRCPLPIKTVSVSSNSSQKKAINAHRPFTHKQLTHPFAATGYSSSITMVRRTSCAGACAAVACALAVAPVPTAGFMASPSLARMGAARSVSQRSRGGQE